MLQKRKKNIVFRVILSNAFILVLGAATVWFGVSASKELYKKYQIRQEIEDIKQEINALEQRNRNLSSFIDSFKDSKIIEREAKRRLNLKRPGEEVVVILRDKNDESQNIVQVDRRDEQLEDSTKIAPEEVGVPNPIKWWQYITDNK